MRKLIVIAAIALACTTAHAGQPRSLSLAAADPAQPVAEQPKPQTASTPKAAPSTATTTAPASTTATATCAPATTAQTPAPVTVANAPATVEAAPATPANAAAASKAQESTKPGYRKTSIEARVIRELHRHGIYW